MFDLTSEPKIRLFLESSSTIFEDKHNEFVMFCPYCDDATRKANPNHGHLYISKNQPVFRCFRCDQSGHLLKLLIDLNFDDSEILQSISELLHFNYKKNHFSQTQLKHRYDTTDSHLQCISSISQFNKKHPAEWDIILKYILHRCGNIILDEFFIYPYFKNNIVGCEFRNSKNQLCNTRLINGNYRYLKTEDNLPLYYFQNINKLEYYTNFVFTEGVFDCINMSLYAHIFNDCFHFAILGKSFKAKLEKFIITELMIGTFTINIVLDDDKYKSLFYDIQGLKMTYNPNITFNFFKPTLSKDVGEFPEIELIHSI